MGEGCGEPDKAGGDGSNLLNFRRRVSDGAAASAGRERVGEVLRDGLATAGVDLGSAPGLALADGSAL